MKSTMSMISGVLLAAVALAGVLLMPLCAGQPSASLTVQEQVWEVSDGQLRERLVFVSSIPYNGTITLDVPSDFQVVAEGTPLQGTWEEGWATIDLGAQGLAVSPGDTLTLEVTYAVPSLLDYHVQYPTTLLTVTLDTDRYPRASLPLAYDHQSNVYEGQLHNLTPGQRITLTFLEPEGGEEGLSPLTWILGALAAVLAVLLALLWRRGRRQRHLEKEPVEALELRKRLLTDALKTLEVEHDRKKISDAYYQSIKDYFKQEAVEVLRELDRRQ